MSLPAEQNFLREKSSLKTWSNWLYDGPDTHADPSIMSKSWVSGMDAVMPPCPTGTSSRMGRSLQLLFTCHSERSMSRGENVNVPIIQRLGGQQISSLHDFETFHIHSINMQDVLSRIMN